MVRLFGLLSESFRESDSELRAIFPDVLREKVDDELRCALWGSRSRLPLCGNLGRLDEDLRFFPKDRIAVEGLLIFVRDALLLGLII